jgi:hypothetical protein
MPLVVSLFYLCKVYADTLKSSWGTGRTRGLKCLKTLVLLRRTAFLAGVPMPLLVTTQPGARLAARLHASSRRRYTHD